MSVGEVPPAKIIKMERNTSSFSSSPSSPSSPPPPPPRHVLPCRFSRLTNSTSSPSHPHHPAVNNISCRFSFSIITPLRKASTPADDITATRRTRRLGAIRLFRRTSKTSTNPRAASFPGSSRTTCVRPKILTLPLHPQTKSSCNPPFTSSRPFSPLQPLRPGSLLFHLPQS